MGNIGAIWGMVGLSMILIRGLFSVLPPALALQDYSFTAIHWVGLVISLIFMGYSEGYKGFQLKFSPRVAARALYLRANPTPARVIFAPLFCMGFFHATRKRKIIAYAVTTMVVLLIVGVRQLPQPWRGIVDVGVLFGLGWGLISVWIYSAKAFFSKTEYTISPETPDV
ncbi:hypothetical protein P4B35_22400 [Pontiellaceae bacterium B12227]|nr:hypothetical protein [Pontiellaceae bacterium B12227]